LLLIIFHLSCSNNKVEQSKFNNKEKNGLSLNTNEQKKLILSKSKMFNSELLYVDTTIGLNNKIDTIELTDMRFACDCPSWFDSLSYSINKSVNMPIDKMDVNSLSFRENCYYIEPADKKLSMTSLLLLPRTRVKLFGKKYIKMKLPSDNSIQDPNSPEGHVFRYYGFEIVRPFKIYSNEFIKNMNNPEIELEEKNMIITIN
jgi:hypothetical protein